MIYLVIAVAALSAVGVFHLFLTMGIIRRLRAQEAQGGRDAAAPTIGIGGRIGAFETTATDGSALGRGGDGRRVTAFFTPDCKACVQQLPQFAAYAAGFAGDVVAVVVADDVAQGLAYNEKLVAVARTVLEPTGGAVATAFGVTSFPAMAVTDADGRVLANGNAVRDLAFLGEAAAVP